MRLSTIAVLFALLLPPAYAEGEAQGLKILAEHKRVELAGTVSAELERYKDELKGAIEYLAVCTGGKEYESLFVLEADPQAICDAMIKLGAKPGKPAYEENDGKPVLPQGDPIRLWVRWMQGEKRKYVRAESFVSDRKTQKPMKSMDWSFTGSRLTWPLDEDSDEQVLEATIMKNIIALHHADPSVLIQNPLKEGAESNRYEKNSKLLPPSGTPITLILQIDPRKESQ